MSGDQWFTLWMMGIQTVGGGLVTLGGVTLGFLLARKGDRQKRWQDEIRFWIDELSRIDRDVLSVQTAAETSSAEPGSDEAEQIEWAQWTILAELIHLVQLRRSPRDSIGDVVINSLTTGIFVDKVDMHAAAQMSREERVAAVTELRGGLPSVHRVLNDTVELLATWRHRGVSKRSMKRAMVTK